jgi:hypothetical protein
LGRSWPRWWRLRRARAAGGDGEEEDDGRHGVDVDVAKEDEEDQHSLASSSSPFLLRFAVAIGAIWSLSARLQRERVRGARLGVTAEGDHHRPAALGRVFFIERGAVSVSSF